MNKQKVIHIQKSDDITSVTESIKNAKSEKLRLVNDTGSTVLKSATNIRLIKKIADKNGKKVVFVSPDSSIKPILAELGLMASTETDSSPYKVEADKKITKKDIVLSGPAAAGKVKTEDQKTAGNEKTEKVEKDSDKKSLSKNKNKNKNKGISIPNFDRFRNKTIIAGVGFLSIIALWFVAFFILPKGDIKIRLQTDKVDVKESITISNTFSSTNVKSNKFKAQRATVEKNVSKKINATGTKNVGEKAKGTVIVENENSSTTENFQVGTKFESSGGLIFVVEDAFSVGPASVQGGQVVPGLGTANVIAQSKGDEYNLSSGTNLTIVNGQGSFNAEVDDIDGGTTEEKTVVAQSDIDGFTETLKQPANEEIQAELERQFDQTMIVLDDTASVELTKVTANPVAGKESDDTTVDVTVVYSIFGISKEDIESLAQEKIKLEAGEKLYSVESSNIVAKTTKKVENQLEVDVNVKGFIGPDLDEAKLTEEIKGLRYSAALEKLESKLGVVGVEIDLSPFWVNKVPDDDVNYEVEVVDTGGDG